MLYLGENSRIMLRRNLDLSKGLCNGRLGYIKKIHYALDQTITSLSILFDGDDSETKIEKITAPYELYRNVYTSRTQFPITLAWSITIHKSQGLSLDGVLVGLGSGIFEPGMAYVALSRARSIKNVHLIDFTNSSLKCNSKAVQEYNRLRKKYVPSLSLIKEWNRDLSNVGLNRTIFNVLLSKSVKNEAQLDKNLEQIKTAEKRKNSENVSYQKKQKIKRDSVIIQRNNHFLRLQNTDGTSCYANCVIKTLLSCGENLFKEVRHLTSSASKHLQFFSFKVLNQINSLFEGSFNVFINNYLSQSSTQMNTYCFRKLVDEISNNLFFHLKIQ